MRHLNIQKNLKKKMNFFQSDIVIISKFIKKRILIKPTITLTR